MRTDVVFTLTGKDRVGIVEEVTRALLELDGNVENSRMARLGGEFAILMLVSLPAENVDRLPVAFEHLTRQGYKITTSETESAQAAPRAGATSYRIQVRGADHEGIIHELAQGLSQQGINIESMETRTTGAPVSGSPLFTMTALVTVPAKLEDSDWVSAVKDAGDQSNVDVTVEQANEPH